MSSKLKSLKILLFLGVNCYLGSTLAKSGLIKNMEIWVLAYCYGLRNVLFLRNRQK